MNTELNANEIGIENEETAVTSVDTAEVVNEAEEHVVEVEPEMPDYSKIVEEDLRALKEEFAELASLKDIYELKNPIRYGALRDLGLTAKEAYLASGGMRSVSDNRAHLHSSVPKGATSPLGEIPRKEFEMVRELFSDLSDGEIQKLYRKVKG